MAQTNDTRKEQRDKLSWIIIIGSLVVIGGLAGLVIFQSNNPQITKDIFYTILPVTASWIGTILAFYFGKQNFESANKQVREMMQKTGPDQKRTTGVTAIMKPFADMAQYKLPAGKTEKDVKISAMQKLLEGKVNRLPVVDINGVVKYMIHEASIDKYIARGGKEDSNLEEFLVKAKEKGFEFGLNKAFVVVKESATLLEANAKMEEYPFARDVFVTRGGTPQEPYIGWISNVRLIKFMEV
jgi:hypothetical protein